MNRRIPRWWVLCLLALLPLGSCATAAKQTVMVPMSDGVKLATDVWLPAGQGPWPVALARTPYNKDAIRGEGLNQLGIALVSQDTRGRSASEGQARPFVTDGRVPPADGLGTVKWIKAQPWCNGRIATFGESALGIAQYELATAAPAGVVASCPVVAPASLYNHGFFEGGVFRQALVEYWLKLTQWPDYAMEDPLAHPDYDQAWRDRDLREWASVVTYPMLHIGGWYDIFCQGQIDAFVALQTKGGEGARGKQHLIMGPWAHNVKNTKVGQLTFPDNAKWPADAPDELKWTISYLLGQTKEMEALPAVRYYVMGDTTDPHAPGNRWRTADAWPPPATPTKLYCTADGQLASAPPKAGARNFTYDPKNPVPTTGGRELTIPPGPFDQRPVESRPDVLVFTGPVLDAPLEVTGHVVVRLFAASSAPDTDWTAKLTDVHPDGRSMLVTDGILRARFRQGFDREVLMKPGTVYEFDLDLSSTSLIFNQGHRLRLAISSSNAPGYEPNPNTGARWRADDKMQTAQQTVHLGGAHASCLILPVVESKGA